MTSKILKRGKYWYLRARVKGKDKWMSLRTTDKAEALQYANAYMANLRTAKFLKISNTPWPTKSRKDIKNKENTSIEEWAREAWVSLNSREKQAIIYTIHRGKCYYCGDQTFLPSRRDLKDDNRVCMDHKIPIAAGGSDTFDNIVLACNACNKAKVDMDADTFIANYLPSVKIKKIPKVKKGI